MTETIPVNVNINPAANGWVIFVTPKFIENAGDRCFVASSPQELRDVISFVSRNEWPETKYSNDPGVRGSGYQMEWPA